MIFRQLFDAESSTYTYLLASQNGDAVIIDPVKEKLERDKKLIRELGLKLKFILETHVHADHITSAFYLKESTGAQIALNQAAGLQHLDKALNDGEELLVGDLKIKAIATPGHTNSCMSYYVHDRVFTGDTLLIRGCGRTDFQEGSSERLFKSVREKLFTLPEDTLVFPAHDYNGFCQSSIKEEKAYNPRLGTQYDLQHFTQIMSNLKLAYPKKMDVAVPYNQRLGKD